jgi:uncharacterized protein DUF5989
MRDAMASSYLERRNARVALARLKREIVFGIAISSLMLGTGAWRYFMVVGTDDRLWSVVAVAGGVGLLLTLVLPWLWRIPQAGVQAIARRVGGVLFAALLAVVYALLVVPVGWALRSLKGADPVYAWESDAPPARMEGWRSKEVTPEANLDGHGKAGVLHTFVKVLQFFARRGHYVFLPTLVILLALGIVLFFVKASALAPFIYTLF